MKNPNFFSTKFIMAITITISATVLLALKVLPVDYYRDIVGLAMMTYAGANILEKKIKK